PAGPPRPAGPRTRCARADRASLGSARADSQDGAGRDLDRARDPGPAGDGPFTVRGAGTSCVSFLSPRRRSLAVGDRASPSTRRAHRGFGTPSQSPGVLYFLRNWTLSITGLLTTPWSSSAITVMIRLCGCRPLYLWTFEKAPPRLMPRS